MALIWVLPTMRKNLQRPEMGFGRIPSPDLEDHPRHRKCLGWAPHYFGYGVPGHLERCPTPTLSLKKSKSITMGTLSSNFLGMTFPIPKVSFPYDCLLPVPKVPPALGSLPQPYPKPSMDGIFTDPWIW